MEPISSVFISRAVKPAGPLAKWVANQGWSLRGQSLLQIEPLEFKLPSGHFDWLFFYSPRAATFFCERAGAIAAATPLAAIGAGTARALRQVGYETQFTGNGDPHKVAKDFLKVAKGLRVLFPRAKRSRRSIEQLLGKEITATDVIVYDNTAAPPPQPIPAEVVILTSPLNAEAWFATHSPQAVDKSLFIALGRSTAAALSAYGIEAPFPAEPTEKATIELLNQLLI